MPGKVRNFQVLPRSRWLSSRPKCFLGQLTLYPYRSVDFPQGFSERRSNENLQTGKVLPH
jgi:hypothetical protein